LLQLFQLLVCHVAAMHCIQECLQLEHVELQMGPVKKVVLVLYVMPKHLHLLQC